MKLKNEALVGLTVILGIFTAVIGAVWLSGRSWGEQEREVVASFARVGGCWPFPGMLGPPFSP